jgi:hypothetical protein
MDEHLTSLLRELLSTKTTRTPGNYSVSLGKVWVSDGAGRTEISVTLNFRVEAELSPAKQAAIAAAFL